MTKEFVVGKKHWRLRANPGYWGSSAPDILVLGFSKGPNQDKKIADGARFEDIPFAEMRNDLRRLLAAAGLVDSNLDIDSLFLSTEPHFGFASLVRCSVSIWGKNSRKQLDWIGTGGNVIGQTIAAAPAFVTECVARHLKAGLPESVKLVVMLGSAKENVRNIMMVLDGKPFNSGPAIHYAYRALGRTVVHLPHPAGGNRDSIKAFCDGTSEIPRDEGTLECRRQVLPAIIAALG
ncbi:hypothetical protein [Pseudonocardia sp.]|uniref:hypothetical protein n=1 Tax=Pseudonocardia sp. TaxID=60912 RepID=UPI002623AE1C|nr:hypothetical protein [Pseudonocardia sp.]